MNLFAQIMVVLFALAWIGMVIGMPFAIYYGFMFWWHAPSKLLFWPEVFFRSDLPPECDVYRKKVFSSGGIVLGFWLAGALFWIGAWLTGRPAI